MDARAILRERASVELIERLEHLDATRRSPPRDRALRPPDRHASLDTDVVFMGGGLCLLLAAEVARLGRRVVVLERARAGAVHREWNASDRELLPLVESGIVTEAELRELVVARYDEGVCRFHGSPPSVVRGVLDRAVDAAPLLARVREVALARGVRFIDGASVDALGAGSSGVRVGWSGGELVARVAVDARGASSPYASADLVCPTVGGVVRGIDFDPRCGDILVTTEDADHGRQHVWEGFPGRAGELTVYLFHYAQRERAGSLIELYARFFRTLHEYRRGVPELVRPTFGFIPGWSRLTPAPRGPHPRVILAGDAAARHSPLTFCGFGAMLRTFQPLARRIAACDSSPPPEERIHAWTGALARLMASQKLEGPALNTLLGAAFSTLAELGNEAYAALLQDRMPARDFLRFLHRTAQRHPMVYREVLRVVGPKAVARWSLQVGRSAFAGPP
ncbi:MAG: lycopene cyclase [Labilithrix sp.]